jgi:hypothetical protein
MVLAQIRDYLHERLAHLRRDWKIFQTNAEDPRSTLTVHNDSDLDRIERSFKFAFSDEQTNLRYQSESATIENILRDKAEHQGFPAEFYLPRDLSYLPDNRKPPTGIIPLPYQYKQGQIVTATPEIPETGFQVDPRIQRIIRSKYPHYQKFLDKYVRPLGTTDATVKDFFKPQLPSVPISTERKELILDIIVKKFAVTPYLPIHFVDSLFDKAPLHTGTGYHQRRSFTLNAHAVFSHPKEYENKPTSKGYYTNAFLEYARTAIHYIKMTGLPFTRAPSDTLAALRTWILERPTTLYTRNHISDRDGNLKQRPVYAVDDLFIRLESMVTFPAHVLARKLECCIMYGYETIRGSNARLDQIARSFKSFFTIDWSGFDQRVPRVISDIFWTDFLERIIVCSNGYAPTYDYPSYPDLTPEKMFSRLSNILHFLHTWYNNMVFITADGYAYARTCAGVPSGLLNTQYLDSFANLFILIDGMLEFGFTVDEISKVLFFVMGDDNSGFTDWTLSRMEKFIDFLADYALRRYGMVLSPTKSSRTTNRGHIETLSYQCNYGMPIRPLGKLVAQLCYPERGPRSKYTSARAIGLAYAACGMNDEFHDLCRDIYYEFLDDAVNPEDPDVIHHIQEYLPGFMRIDETIQQQINLTTFPSFWTVRQHVERWQGPLSFYPKWDRAHFVNDPDVIPPSSETMSEYRNRLQIPRPEVPDIWSQLV